ncbi:MULTISPECIES: hypothetical protein [Pseudomonas]|uniref:hypothetical protein n=1 Tax=Pseudomonas TaxID=286 RepID=UPI000CFCE828|nr:MULTISPECIES: hypothetical protein [Pseudomonas]PQZ85062.1 hypothetical protein CQ048_24385 [Pseudomonas trivialis]PRB21263.1 hypothetical protein CQ041_24035 [Pseudomonas sp. MYb60]
MNLPNGNLTREALKERHAKVKGGKGSATIQYSFNGEQKAFLAPRVSDSLIRTLISDFGGTEAALALHYPGELKEGRNEFSLKDLSQVAFYLNAFDTYTVPQSGTVEVSVVFSGTGNDEIATITGTITDAVVSKGGTDQVKCWGTFDYIFPDRSNL